MAVQGFWRAVTQRPDSGGARPGGPKPATTNVDLDCGPIETGVADPSGDESEKY